MQNNTIHKGSKQEILCVCVFVIILFVIIDVAFKQADNVSNGCHKCRVLKKSIHINILQLIHKHIKSLTINYLTNDQTIKPPNELCR